jgi:hypothetical protein
VQHETAVCELSGCELPAPIGWGSGRRGSTSGACMSPREWLRLPPEQPGLCHGAWALHPSRAGLALTKAQDPTRLPRISIWARSRTNLLWRDPSPRGLRPPFGFCLPGAPFCAGQRPPAPFRATGLLLRSTPSPRSASRPTLGHGVKMLRNRFYNQRLASRAPMSKHHLWRLPVDHRGKTRRRSTSRSPVGARALMGALCPSGDAGPPCGHPASDRCTLDGASRASGRPAATLVALGARWGRSTAALSACGGSAESDPLTPLVDACACCGRDRDR